MAWELHKANAKLALSVHFHVLLLLAVPCFAFQLAVLMKCIQVMMRYRPTCLLLSLIAVRTVIVNGILETPGPPAFARGILVHLHRYCRDSWRLAGLILQAAGF
jgi:hypothetical protein